MRSFWKKSVLLALALTLTWLVSGCSFFSSAESLFTLPRLPIEYTDLSNQIQTLLAEGYEYASPTGGRNIQSVQMVDLDGDGDEEAVAFFRRGNDEKPLKIFVFRANEESYDLLCTVESSGTAVDSVYYRDLTGDGVSELVVGWRISSDVQTVAAYSIAARPVLLMQSSYIRSSIEELDGDGVPSLLVLRADDQGNSLAEFYSWQEDKMGVSYTARLSGTMAELASGNVVSGALTGKSRGIYITGISDESVATTDVLTYREGAGLVNVALDQWTGSSGLVCPYLQLKPQDIDGDGIVEVPKPRTDSMGQPTGVVEWLRLDEQGWTDLAMTTYHDVSGGWYFVLPGSWSGRVKVLHNEHSAFEIQTTLLVGDTEVADLYTLTGENRENRALRGSRMVLKRQTGTVYAGELLPGAAGCGLTEELLRQNFRLIVNQWTNG